jgi:hypothetical protein
MTITASISPTITSGVAPLAVLFNASGTTSTETTKPFREILMIVNFGDDNAGDFSTGAWSNISRNLHIGTLMAAHVYAEPGTYTARFSFYDGVSWAFSTESITVTDPDAVYSGTNTICISNAGLTTGGPFGCEYSTAISDLDSALSTYGAANKRLLFNRGDTFISSAVGSMASANLYIGAWGTGEKPIFQAGADVGGIVRPNNSNQYISGIDFFGDIYTSTGISAIAGSATRLTIYGNRFRNIEPAVAPDSIAIFDQLCFSENNCTQINGGGGSNGFYFGGSNLIFLGNNMDDATDAEHCTRLQWCKNGVVSANTFKDPASNKHSFTLRAATWAGTVIYPAGEYSENVSVNNNYFGGSNEAGSVANVTVAPKNDDIGTDERIRNVVVENNFFEAGVGTSTNMTVKAVGVTSRNNISLLNSGIGNAFVSIGNTVDSPTPDDVAVFNETFYSIATGTGLKGVQISSNPTNTIVKNCLAWAPNATSFDMISGTGASGLDATNNTLDAEAVGTDPDFDGPLTSPKGFRYATNGYGQNAGTAVFPASNNDFFNCDDVTANVHIGAFVPRARATCRGVK